MVSSLHVVPLLIWLLSSEYSVHMYGTSELHKFGVKKKNPSSNRPDHEAILNSLLTAMPTP